MTVYIVSHKQFAAPVTLPDSYVPLFVGRNEDDLASKHDGITDATGDNIAQQNDSFCELTAMYWIWKNSNSKVKGLVHYRRFFVNKINHNQAIDADTIDKLLASYDFIVPEKYWLLENVIDHYAGHHNVDDLRLVRSIIAENNSSYLSSFDDCMQKKYIYPYNMFISSSEYYDSYCEWLFPLLFEAYDRIDFSDRNDYQRRVFGFLSERLFAVYLVHNNYRLREYPVITTERSIKRSISMGLAKILNGRKNE